MRSRAARKGNIKARRAASARVRYRKFVQDRAPPPPIQPGVATFPQPSEKIGTSRGCFKWGLIGCAGLSVVVIVGLVVLGTKAKGFLDSKLREKGEEIVAKATPDVTDAATSAFQ